MEPISREFLLKQKKCCNNGCANCPYKINKTNKIMNAKEYLHSDEISEWDTVFDPGGKQEYTEDQLIRFAEIWSDKKLLKELENLSSVFPFTPIEMDKRIKELKQ